MPGFVLSSEILSIIVLLFNRSAMFRKIIDKISSHFLLRNVVIALCAVVVFLYLVSLALNIFTRHGDSYPVVDLIGKSVDEAVDLIVDADLELVVVDSLFVAGMAPGTIIDQSPKVGSAVKSGRKVFLIINSINPPSDIIPYVTGFSLRQAKNIIESKGFQIDKLIYRDDMATNNIIGEQYDGRTVERGSTLRATLGEGITLIVGRSSSSALPSVPKIIGLTLREAKSRLWEVGLNIGQVRRDADVTESNLDDAKVYKQSPGQMTRMDYGASVSVHLTLDQSKINQGSKKSDTDARNTAPDQQDISDEELARLLAQ